MLRKSFVWSLTVKVKCLKWVAQLTNFDNVGDMIEQVEQSADKESEVVFLPYLSGERTPHNNPDAKGVFFGMTHTTTRLELAQAVMEGVGFAFADGFDALHVTKNIPEEVSLIGGGARSQYWRQMLANIVNMPLVYREGGDVGPALGAARLAILGTLEGATLHDICPTPKLVERHEPNSVAVEQYKKKRLVYQALYQQLKDLF
ncbi:FGGY-family carbohydrate kinase [Vibrio sp. DNB22_10_4]